MTDDVHFPEYRAGSRWGLGGPSIGLVGITAGLAQLARSGAPLWLLLGLPVFLVVFFVVVAVLVRRTATLTSEKYIEAQKPFGARKVAWRDVQAIEIVGNPAAAADAAAVSQSVVVFDREGRRILLPHLNDKSVFAVEEEVRDLRTLWERLRGEDWAPTPEAVAGVTKTHRGVALQRAWITAILLTCGAFVAAGVLFVVLLLVGVIDADEEGFLGVLLSPGVFMATPAVLVLVWYVAFGRRRGQGEGHGDGTPSAGTARPRRNPGTHT